jgi:hypothetical protein
VLVDEAAHFGRVGSSSVAKHTLRLVETRTFPDGVLLTRYETRR